MKKTRKKLSIPENIIERGRRKKHNVSFKNFDSLTGSVSSKAPLEINNTFHLLLERYYLNLNDKTSTKELNTD